MLEMPTDFQEKLRKKCLELLEAVQELNEVLDDNDTPQDQEASRTS